MDELKSLFRGQWGQIGLWFFYNIFIGTAFVWLSWLPWIYSANPRFDFFENIRNGNLLVFTISLSASSLGFYSEITKDYMLQLRRFLTAVFLTLIIITTFVYANGAAQRESESYQVVRFLWFSAFLFSIGFALSFISYVVRLRFQSVFDRRAEEQRAVSELSKQAATHNEAGGIKL